MARFLIVMIIAFLVVACAAGDDIPTLEVGQEFANSNVRILVLDSFEVKLSTFKFDSINTSNTDRLLFGQYEDEYFGKVRAIPYFELVAASVESSGGAYAIDDEAELDSVALVLGYDNYFYNDTTATLEINLHQLLEDVVPDDGVFYNTSEIRFDSIPLVTKLFQPEPQDEDSLHVSLPLKFGQDIFDRILSNDINNNQDLREVFKGFTLHPGINDNASVIGFSKNQGNTYLRFFYSVREELEVREEVLDLSIISSSSGATAFHNITNETEATFLGELMDQEAELVSENAADLAFIQSGTGYATKVVFPTLKAIYDIEGTGTILSAQLRIKPLRRANTDLTPVRDSLDTGILDLNNIISQEVRNGAGIVKGVLVGENEEFETIVYEIPVGTFIDSKLNEQRETGTSLVLFNESFNETVNRCVLQGENNEDFSARVVITYAIYDE